MLPGGRMEKNGMAPFSKGLPVEFEGGFCYSSEIRLLKRFNVFQDREKADVFIGKLRNCDSILCDHDVLLGFVGQYPKTRWQNMAVRAFLLGLRFWCGDHLACFRPDDGVAGGIWNEFL